LICSAVASFLQIERDCSKSDFTDLICLSISFIWSLYFLGILYSSSLFSASVFSSSIILFTSSLEFSKSDSEDKLSLKQ
jgi:hypothetical protein